MELHLRDIWGVTHSPYGIRITVLPDCMHATWHKWTHHALTLARHTYSCQKTSMPCTCTLGSYRAEVNSPDVWSKALLWRKHDQQSQWNTRRRCISFVCILRLFYLVFTVTLCYILPFLYIIHIFSCRGCKCVFNEVLFLFLLFVAQWRFRQIKTQTI